MAADRPPASELPVVDGEECVLRLINPRQYDYVANEVLSSALQSREWKGKPDAVDYGPSVYVVSKLGNPPEADLERAHPPWSRFGVARILVSELRKRHGLDVRLTPMDCRIDAIRHAHATLFNVTPENRDAIVTTLTERLTRPPKNPDDEIQ